MSVVSFVYISEWQKISGLLFILNGIYIKLPYSRV